MGRGYKGDKRVRFEEAKVVGPSEKMMYCCCCCQVRACTEKVHVFVNARYKGRSLSHLLLRREISVYVCADADMWEVWKEAQKQSKRLQNAKVYRKVIATDRARKCSTVLAGKGQVKDVYLQKERHWVFVVQEQK